jgi:hypothetical protein
MRKAYQIFAYLIALEVVIQAAAIAYALAGLGKWVEDDGGVLTKAKLDDDNALTFQGVGGFEVHGLNGMMLIPLITIIFLIISFFSNVPGAPKRAGIIFVLVAVQIALGLGLHGVVVLAPLHALNGFILFSLAAMTGAQVGRTAPVSTSPAPEPVTTA